MLTELLESLICEAFVSFVFTDCYGYRKGLLGALVVGRQEGPEKRPLQ